MGSVPAGQAIWQEDRARLIVQAVVGIIAPRLEALIGPDLWAMDARDMELWVRDLLRQAGAAIATELLHVAAEHHMFQVRPTSQPVGIRCIWRSALHPAPLSA